MKQDNKPKLSPDERVKKCGEAFQAAMKEYGCQVYPALKIGNAVTPLLEIGGLRIEVQVGIDPQT